MRNRGSAPQPEASGVPALFGPGTPIPQYLLTVICTSKQTALRSAQAIGLPPFDEDLNKLCAEAFEVSRRPADGFHVDHVGK